jgi:hypothetical protein
LGRTYSVSQLMMCPPWRSGRGDQVGRFRADRAFGGRCDLFLAIPEKEPKLSKARRHGFRKVLARTSRSLSASFPTSKEETVPRAG